MEWMLTKQRMKIYKLIMNVMVVFEEKTQVGLD